VMSKVYINPFAWTDTVESRECGARIDPTVINIFLSFLNFQLFFSITGKTVNINNSSWYSPMEIEMEILHIIDVPRVILFSLSLWNSRYLILGFFVVWLNLFFSPLYYLRFKYTILMPFLKYLFISHNIL